MNAKEQTYHELKNELVNAVNDYGSEAASNYMAGWGREVESEWVGHAREHGVEQTVRAIDEYCEED